MSQIFVRVIASGVRSNKTVDHDFRVYEKFKFEIDVVFSRDATASGNYVQAVTPSFGRCRQLRN